MIESAAATDAAYRLLFIASPSDTAELAELERAGADYVVMDADYPRGDYPRKINHGAAITEEEWIFTGADDLSFRPGWFASALAAKRRPTLFIGTNDLGSQRVMDGRHSTHSLIHRDYFELGTIDEPRKIYHEGYWHEYCDDEAFQTAEYRGMMRHSRGAHVEHLHPSWGKAPLDRTYEAHKAERNAQGKALYESRRHLWGR